MENIIKDEKMLLKFMHTALQLNIVLVGECFLNGVLKYVLILFPEKHMPCL